MTRRLALLAAAVALSLSAQTGPRTLKPQPNLPIDCASYSQPCTGTVCILQQTEYTCNGEVHTCQNDTQVWMGGDRICCTGKNLCFECEVNGRTYRYYSYNSNSSGCVPNH